MDERNPHNFLTEAPCLQTVEMEIFTVRSGSEQLEGLEIHLAYSCGGVFMDIYLPLSLNHIKKQLIQQIDFFCSKDAIPYGEINLPPPIEDYNVEEGA